ncbi:hypothetical protein HPB47_006931, partial [Ixodes persulcatus]
YPQRQGPMPPLHALAGNPPRPSPPGYPGPPYGYGMGGGPPPQLRHLLNQGPLNQKGQGPSMAALSHMARLGPPAMTGGGYAMQKVAPGGHPMHSPLQPGIRHPQQHQGSVAPSVVLQQHVPITLNSSITISPITSDKSRSSGNGPLPCPPPLATGVQIIPQPKTQVIMLDSTGAARAAALQQQQRRMSATSSSSSGGTPPSTRIPSHLIQGGSPRLPEASVLERNNSITITPVVAQSVASARTSSPSVSVVRIKEEPKSPGEQQLPSCSGDSAPRAVQAPLNGTRASPSETAAGMASRSLVRDLAYLAIT